MRAKEGHASFLDWLPLMGCLGVIIGPWLLYCFAPEFQESRQIITEIEKHAWGISISGVVLFLGYMFWHSFGQWDDLNEKQKPAFECECDTNIPRFREIVMVQVPFGDSIRSYPETFFRMSVCVPPPNTVKECSACLISVKLDGQETISCPRIDLKFSRGASPETKRAISNGMPEWVDIIAINNTGDGSARVPSELAPRLFHRQGEYVLSGVVTGDGVAHKPFELKFSWVGGDTLSQLVSITEQA